MIAFDSERQIDVWGCKKIGMVGKTIQQFRHKTEENKSNYLT